MANPKPLTAPALGSPGPDPRWPSSTTLPPPVDAAGVWRTDGSQFNDAVFDVTAASAGVRVPEQAGVEILRVTFTADGANSAPVIVQRGIGPRGATAPSFTGADAYSVPAGQHFTAEGRADQWWIKAAINADVVHLVAKRI